ncbi:DUF1345 domain-containing protein [Microbacterium mitrae]|uniref:DUF1345 domain-containing protein n=1 Tax=Microbacterium mitrae TaxID=664640 RepID=A0A5C8HL76_9MICO|nr:DUF1345 domain-containing protein [Microbacterium mitrae]TXK04170.1 DUF1345 domain-containing protein [Microbacterium mitrae]
MKAVVRRSWVDWIGALASLLILVTCLTYVVSDEVWALLLWEVVSSIYLFVGFIVVWRSKRVHEPDRDTARTIVGWMWVSPILAALAGANAAVTALLARAFGGDDVNALLLVIAASAAIVISWMLLQVGFSEMYQAVAASGDGNDLIFPGEAPPTTMDYLYFAFTLGTSFATSDVEVISTRARRVVRAQRDGVLFQRACARRGVPDFARIAL